MSEKSRSDFTPVPKVSAVPPMRYETPLVPRNSISGRALVAVVAIMTFLASLTTGGVILVSQAARGPGEEMGEASLGPVFDAFLGRVR